MAPSRELDNQHSKLVESKGVEEEEEESFCYAVQLATSSVLPMSLHAAVELGVFEIIAKASNGAKLSADEIAAQMAANNNPDAAVMLDRVLRLLASHSVLACSVINADDHDGRSFRRVYSLAPVSKYFVTNGDGVSLRPFMALIQDKMHVYYYTTQYCCTEYYLNRSQLKDAILEGGLPFNRAHGMHAFKYTELNPKFNQLYNKAMYNVATIVVNKILESYNGFEHLTHLVDVGGNLGITLNLIISKYPRIKAINFDLPQVIEHAPSYPGVEHIGGDMFENVPTGDAILLKSILHDWSDEPCLKILNNCYKAIPENGKVIVVEEILPVKPETKNSVKSTSQTDVLMMTKNPGGKERSQEEYLALATAAGFTGVYFESCGCNFWVMEFFK
ncbi:O-methyltransferase COMT-type [Parasponia andersonii]|uniref:caffeate O-methyltransferase n=1 Tax=Parasponia andersonii TaxID=3476 RepID=A0A2P5E098_PARAD|nr:O-methyltransferase COMT-type [Parasponia andersonii]